MTSWSPLVLRLLPLLHVLFVLATALSRHGEPTIVLWMITALCRRELRRNINVPLLGLLVASLILNWNAIFENHELWINCLLCWVQALFWMVYCVSCATHYRSMMELWIHTRDWNRPSYVSCTLPTTGTITVGVLLDATGEFGVCPPVWCAATLLWDTDCHPSLQQQMWLLLLGCGTAAEVSLWVRDAAAADEALGGLATALVLLICVLSIQARQLFLLVWVNDRKASAAARPSGRTLAPSV